MEALRREAHRLEADLEVSIHEKPRKRSCPLNFLSCPAYITPIFSAQQGRATL